MKKYFLVFSILYAHAAYGSTFRLTTYGNEQGLPSNLTKAIIQDAAGFIWIGSDAGLARFDGRTFVTFTEHLPSPFVKQFFLDRSNRLLIVTDLGITAVEERGSTHRFSTLIAATPQHTDTTLFYPKGLFASADGSLWISEPDAVVRYANGRIRRYPFVEKYRADSYVRSFQFIEKRDGTLYVLSERGYLFRFDPKADAFELFANEQPSAPFLIDAVLLDPSGAIIIGGSRGIFELRESPAAKSYSLTRLSPLPSVSSLVLAKDGSIYAGTWLSGLHRLERRHGKWTAVPSPLPLKVINALVCGRDGEIWVSSDEGIGLMSETHFADVPLPLSNYYIEAVTESPDGAVLVTDGSSVIRVDVTTAGLKPETIFHRTESLILSLATDGTTVWIGYRDGFLTELKNGAAKKVAVPAGGNRLLNYLFVDSNKNLWICQDGLIGVYKLSPDGRMTFYDASKGITSHISVVKESPQGAILCGGTGASAYLFQYDQATDRFVNKSVPIPGAAAGISTDDLAAGPGGAVWLGTSNGLLLYDNGSAAAPPGFELFSKEPVKSVALDPLGTLWVGTDHGVLRYADHQVARFDGSDGLTSMTMAYRACLVDRMRKVWLGTAHGTSRWNRSSDRIGETPVPLLLSVDVNGKLMADSALSNTPLEYHSYVSVKVASLTYPSEKIQYRYRVKELSPEWTMPSSSSTVVIPQLNEGTFILEISAQQSGCLWSEPAVMSLAVAPPFYRTWWMYLFYASFVGTGIAAVVRFRIEVVARRQLRSALFES